jgi:hypothetical protein
MLSIRACVRLLYAKTGPGSKAVTHNDALLASTMPNKRGIEMVPSGTACRGSLDLPY